MRVLPHPPVRFGDGGGCLNAQRNHSKVRSAHSEHVTPYEALTVYRRFRRGITVGVRAVPSGTLQAMYLGAQKLMLERCVEFLDNIDHGDVIVSSPRLAALLSAIARTTAPNQELVTRVIGTLQKAGVATDHSDSVAWPWYLSGSGSTDERSAEVGPTALLLNAILAIEPLLRAANSPILEKAVSLIDSSANYLCSTFESKYHASMEELVVCMSALRTYVERPVPTELLRRRAAIVNSRQQILVEELFEAFASPVGLPVITLKSRDRVKAVMPQGKDATYDIFLHGPLISAFLGSPNPSHHELASIALRQALTVLATATNTDRPISTHWLGSVIDALPTSADVLMLDKKQPFAPFRRFVTVPENRVTFLVLSDTQFGLDSTADRSPLGSRDSFDEVKAAKFEQLAQDAATKLIDSRVSVSPWSGLLHIGDVVCRGDFEQQEKNALSALRDSTAILGVPTKSFVACPGNHDLTRSSLVGALPRILDRPRAGGGDWVSFGRDLIAAFSRLVGRTRPKDSISIGRDLIAALREESSYPVLAQPGFGCFRDMYSRLVERQINISEGGVEVVSFLAPRITVHVVSLWPLMRHRISRGGGERSEQYGLSPRAHKNVRDFLKTADASDIVILLCHVPPQHVTSWSDKDGDRADWLGPTIAKDMASFLDSVLDQVSVEETQPAIHLVLSGHMQEPPILTQYRSVWSYTAGAFHLHSGVSKGTFAARVSVDEGAVRIDSAGLDSRSITSPVPTIIAIGNGRIGAASYDEHVLSTYDAEAEQFIKATDVAGKYLSLKRFGTGLHR